MDRALKIINDNKLLIERFTNLAYGIDRTYDSTHKWFYSLISKEEVIRLQSYTSRDDLRSEIISHIILRLQNYNKTDYEFSLFLHKSIGWYLKDFLLKIDRQTNKHEFYKDYISYQTVNDYLSLDWVFNNKNNHLDIYDRFLLYLYVDKMHSIDRIASIVYQEKTTIRKNIKRIKNVFRSINYAKNTN
jgi:hypothetical protein